MIKPAIAVRDVHKFLWNHIQADLNLIGRAVDKGRDEVLLLVHSLLSGMVHTTSRMIAFVIALTQISFL